jgi:hypothetical protein
VAFCRSQVPEGEENAPDQDLHSTSPVGLEPGSTWVWLRIISCWIMLVSRTPEMHSFVMILNLVSYGAVAALIAAVAACAMRRWPLAVSVSRAVVLAGPVILLASVLACIVLPLRAPGGDEPSSKAAVLSVGISRVMNSGGIAIVAAIFGAIVWGVARSRLRAVGRKAAG